MRMFIAAAAGLCVAGAAQASRATPGGQNAGNGVIELLSLTAGPASNTEPLYQFFRTDPNDVDRLSDARLFVRLDDPTQSREYALTSGQVNGFACSTSFFGDLTGQNDTAGLDHAITITTPTTTHQISVQERYHIIDTPFGPHIEARATFTNNGSSAVTLHTFQFFDIDPGGAPAAQLFQNLPGSTGGFLLTNQGGPPSDSMFVDPVTARATEPVGFHAAGDGSVRNGLFDTSVTDYSQRGDDPGMGSGDFQVAYQWTLDLDPGESVTIGADFGFDVIPAPGAGALLALGALGCARRRR